MPFGATTVNPDVYGEFQRILSECTLKDSLWMREAVLQDIEGPYYIEYGDVWVDLNWTRPGQDGKRDPLHVCDGSGELAVAFDVEDGTLLARGSVDKVTAKAEHQRRTFIDNGFESIAASIIVISFPVTPETVAELNACAEISGRVLKLADNLSKLLETRPELLATPRYPVN